VKKLSFPEPSWLVEYLHRQLKLRFVAPKGAPELYSSDTSCVYWGEGAGRVGRLPFPNSVAGGVNAANYAPGFWRQCKEFDTSRQHSGRGKRQNAISSPAILWSENVSATTYPTRGAVSSTLNLDLSISGSVVKSYHPTVMKLGAKCPARLRSIRLPFTNTSPAGGAVPIKKICDSVVWWLSGDKQRKGIALPRLEMPL